METSEPVDIVRNFKGSKKTSAVDEPVRERAKSELSLLDLYPAIGGETEPLPTGGSIGGHTAVCEPCSICLADEIGDPVDLRCGHTFCSRCLTSASLTNGNKCPLCRAEHELSPAVLHARSAKHRAGYSSWRKGGARGAHGEVADVSNPSGPKVSNLQPNEQAVSNRAPFCFQP